jgi:hypothetical protein
MLIEFSKVYVKSATILPEDAVVGKLANLQGCEMLFAVFW